MPIVVGLNEDGTTLGEAAFERGENMHSVLVCLSDVSTTKQSTSSIAVSAYKRTCSKDQENVHNFLQSCSEIEYAINENNAFK